MARNRTRALVSTFRGMVGIADVWLRVFGRTNEPMTIVYFGW